MKTLDRWIAEEVMGEDCRLENVLWENSIFHKPYTTDLNLAVKAGQKADLWHRHHFGEDMYIWIVFEINVSTQGGGRHLNILAQHEHPATAICLAIYKLKTGEEWKDKS